MFQKFKYFDWKENIENEPLDDGHIEPSNFCFFRFFKNYYSITLFSYSAITSRNAMDFCQKQNKNTVEYSYSTLDIHLLYTSTAHM